MDDLKPLECNWLALWKDVWERDDPYRCRENVYLDKESGELVR